MNPKIDADVNPRYPKTQRAHTTKRNAIESTLKTKRKFPEDDAGPHPEAVPHGLDLPIEAPGLELVHFFIGELLSDRVDCSGECSTSSNHSTMLHPESRTCGYHNDRLFVREGSERPIMIIKSSTRTIHWVKANGWDEWTPNQPSLSQQWNRARSYERKNVPVVSRLADQVMIPDYATNYISILSTVIRQLAMKRGSRYSLCRKQLRIPRRKCVKVIQGLQGKETNEMVKSAWTYWKTGTVRPYPWWSTDMDMSKYTRSLLATPLTAYCYCSSLVCCGNLRHNWSAFGHDPVMLL